MEGKRKIFQLHEVPKHQCNRTFIIIYSSSDQNHKVVPTRKQRQTHSQGGDCGSGIGFVDCSFTDAAIRQIRSCQLQEVWKEYRTQEGKEKETHFKYTQKAKIKTNKPYQKPNQTNSQKTLFLPENSFILVTYY